MAVGFDLSLSLRSLLLLTEVYKSNVLHTLLVDNVNAKNTNNADMQTSYITKFQQLKNKNKITGFFFTIGLIVTVVGVRGR
jgi:hypothetical protein